MSNKLKPGDVVVLASSNTAFTKAAGVPICCVVATDAGHFLVRHSLPEIRLSGMAKKRLNKLMKQRLAALKQAGKPYMRGK